MTFALGIARIAIAGSGEFENACPIPLELVMLPYGEGNTTAIVREYVAQLAESPTDIPQDAIVRELLGRAVGRLHLLCATVLYQRYPRLTQAPLNLQAEELLSSVVERLLKAMRNARPTGVRQFFALANQHMRWELNDLARRLDKEDPDIQLMETLAMAPESSGNELSQSARRMLQAIDDLPEDEREVFSLIRIQNVTQSEAAEILGVSVKTIQRRLNRSLVLLTQSLADLDFGSNEADKS
jgi:RNA polymerase sigma-70 factor (ECF subfamily)